MTVREVAGAAVCGLLLAGCTGSEAPGPDRPEIERPAADLSDWSPPDGAPEFCTVLAGAEHVENIPEAVGSLLTDPTDPHQAWRLTQGTRSLRAALDSVRREEEHGELATALDGLITTVTIASSGPLDRAAPQQIADGLAAVGRLAQPVCEYPT